MKTKKLGAAILALITTVSSFASICSIQVHAAGSIESALNWAVAIANDDSHWYSQSSRNGPNYDCSSLVFYALKDAGFDVGGSAFTTRNMRGILTNIGFEWIPWNQIGDKSNLQRGDILLDEGAHTEFYLGESKCVAAANSDQGIIIENYWNGYGGVSWDGVLRYKEEYDNTDRWPEKPIVHVDVGYSNTDTFVSWQACKDIADPYYCFIYNCSTGEECYWHTDEYSYPVTERTQVTAKLSTGEYYVEVTACNHEYLTTTTSGVPYITKSLAELEQATKIPNNERSYGDQWGYNRSGQVGYCFDNACIWFEVGRNTENHKTFNSNENRGKHAWKVLQQISDQICREQQLYIIPNPDQRKGKCWYEWQHDQQGSSWKKQLKHGIDEAIMSSSNLSDFWEECRRRNIEFQYRPDRRISLKIRMTDAGQEKWTRARTLGWYYEPEQIEKRIANYAAFVRGEINYAPKTKIIDTTQERFAEAPGLERWAMLRNMQEASRMINFLTERGLTSPEDLNDRAVHEFDRRMKLVADLNDTQQKIDRITDDIALITRYRKLRPVYDASFTATFRKKYAADHAQELQQYDAAEKQMQARFPEHSVPKIERLEQEKARLTELRRTLNEEYKTCKAEIAELEKARETITEYLRQTDTNRTKDTLE